MIRHILADKEFLLNYHIGEEILVFLVCMAIAYRAAKTSSRKDPKLDRETANRSYLLTAGFAILGASSFIHAFIHAAHLDLNLLYQTLLGYCLGFLTIILSISAQKPWTKRAFPLLYLPLLVLLVPDIYSTFPIFGEFRPLVWISVAYFSGVVCMLFIAAFYRAKSKTILASAVGFGLICISSIFIFFPDAIGSITWLHGHLIRPIGFAILFFSIRPMEFLKPGGSILYRALMAFSLLAAVPLLIFGTVLFYETISPIDIEGRRLLVFLLLLVTFASALIFGLGMIIRLINPILQLKDSVGTLVDDGLNKRVDVKSNDEIGQLSTAFNEMIINLRQAIEEQERLCRLASTGELAATLAHEIKNPLNAIGGAASYIGKNYSGSLIAEFVKIISDEAVRINKLTSTLLNFARPVQPQPEPNDINTLVEETISLLSQESKEHQVTLEKHLAQRLPLVNCDYNQIKQILINLLINSFDASRQGGTVTVETKCNNGNVLISVEDNGNGIPPENINHIFNPFFTTKTRGTGLGLAISKKIAREHSGDLLVKSTAGQGSIFTLVLIGGNQQG
jgi:signal transduction histidine kinase